MTDVSNAADARSGEFRAKLGTRLVLWSTAGLIVLAVVVMIASIWTGDKTAPLASAQLLLSALLPLFATWVGTVLAFYYTKENYQAATQGTLDIVKTFNQRLASTRIAEVMMQRRAIISLLVPAAGLGAVSLVEIEAKFATVGANGGKISRLHFYDAGDKAVAILHRAIWMEMLVAGLQSNPPVATNAGTLSALIAKPYNSPAGATFEDFITKTIAFVAIDRTTADAKAAMDAVPACQDVIVTQTGLRSEPVVGWVSNVDIGRLSQA